MFAITGSVDISQVVGGVAAIQDQLPFATSLGINRTANLVKKAVVAEMRAKFEAPTRWTLNSVYVKPSTKDDLEAVVWLKDDFSDTSGRVGTPAQKYLSPMIFGGVRPAKSFEVLLHKQGVLESGMLAVPGNYVEYLMDQYGNLSGGLLYSMRSSLGINPDIGYDSNGKKEKKPRGSKKDKAQYFVMGREHPIGIGRRELGSKQAEIFLKFVNAPNYDANYFDFFGVAEQTRDENLSNEMQKALAYALSNPKK